MNSTVSADVAVLQCPNYDDAALDRTIAEAACIAGFPDINGAQVLIKPNVLNASPAAKAVTTNPAFVGAVIRFVRTKGAKTIFVGDSPGWQPTMLAARVSGIYDAVVRNGAQWVDFREITAHPISDGKSLRIFRSQRFSKTSTL